MSSLIKRRPSPAMVVAMTALIAGLLGTAYAATKINGKQIKNGSIPGKKLKANTVTGAKVNESTLAGVNAAKLGGKASSAFQPNGAVIGGSGDPTAVSQPIMTIPALGLQLETDNAATTLNQVVARNTGGQSVTIISGTGAGEANTITGVGSTFGLFANAGDFGGGPGSLEVLVVSGANASVINCFFPDEGQVGFDYCQATTATES